MPEHEPLTRSQICRKASSVSAAKRRSQMQEIREHRKQLQAAYPHLLVWKPKELALVIWHCDELGRLLTPAGQRADVFAIEVANAS